MPSKNHLKVHSLYAFYRQACICLNSISPLLLFCLLAFHNSSSFAWVYSGGDKGGTKYSPLNQINRENIAQLKLAWTVRSGEHQTLPAAHYQRSNMQSTPIFLPKVAGQHLIVCSSHNYLLALDPETGAERWRYDPKVPVIDRIVGYKCRGNAFYWEDTLTAPDQACRHRLFMATLDRRVIALDAKSGALCRGFAKGGILTLLSPEDESKYRQPMIFSTSQPVVVNGHLIIGSSVADFIYRDTPPGTINAYSAHDGVQKWVFDLIPTDVADPAAMSWPDTLAARSGAANAWAPLSADEDNKLVFVPTGSASPDFYGGDRKGDNLYSDSLIALNTQTGKRVWHYQFVHHDLWDYDTPAQPTLFDFKRDGKIVPAVLQVTKQGMLFIFNRLTGEPLIPIEERTVPKSEVPGEHISSTQPFSQLPALVRHKVEEEDVWGLTPIDRWLCRRSLKKFRNEGLFTPPGFGKPSVHFPSDGGGANWGGAAITPDNLLLVNMMDVAQTLELIPIKDLKGELKPRDRSKGLIGVTYPVKIKGTDYAFRKLPWLSPLGIPCVAPPWNKVIALNLNTLTIQWEAPLGSVHDQLGVTLPFDINGLGIPGIGAGVVTAGGVFVIGATSDRTIRAFDTSNGEMLWSHRLPVDAMSGVSTYEINGKQYFVTTAGGHASLVRESGDYILAFTLPD